jgi:hypothetical protein
VGEGSRRRGWERGVAFFAAAVAATVSVVVLQPGVVVCPAVAAITVSVGLQSDAALSTAAAVAPNVSVVLQDGVVLCSAAGAARVGLGLGVALIFTAAEAVFLQQGAIISIIVVIVVLGNAQQLNATLSAAVDIALQHAAVPSTSTAISGLLLDGRLLYLRLLHIARQRPPSTNPLDVEEDGDVPCPEAMAFAYASHWTRRVSYCAITAARIDSTH